MPSLVYTSIVIGAAILVLRRILLRLRGPRASWEDSNFICTDVCVGYETKALRLRHLPAFNTSSCRVCPAWFAAGAAVGSLAQIAASLFLVWNLATALAAVARGATLADAASAALLQPLTPASSDDSCSFFTFWCAAALTFFVHESGHALAAAAHGIPITGAGVFFTALFPGMYVRLDTVAVTRAAATTRLSVFSAGIWQNLALCAVCFAALQGTALAPVAAVLYTIPSYDGGDAYNAATGGTHSARGGGGDSISSGVTVVRLNPDGVVAGVLEPGAQLLSIHSCRTRTVAELVTALEALRRGHHQGGVRGGARVNGGFCAPRDWPHVAEAAAAAAMQRGSGNGELSCCDDVVRTGSYSNEQRCLLMEPLLSAAATSQPAPHTLTVGDSAWRLHSCQPAAALKALMHPFRACSAHADCETPLAAGGGDVVNAGRIHLSAAAGDQTLQQQQLCLRPVTPATELLVAVTARGAAPRRHNFNFMFEGEPATLLSSVELSDWAPRDVYWHLWPWFWRWLLVLPAQAAAFAWLVLQMSSSMALANAAPVFYLDGEHILHAATDAQAADLAILSGLVAAIHRVVYQKTASQEVMENIVVKAKSAW
ncbi:hypothetical protein JKP88DRAFT_292234 [Tribonema minus]|uniref:Endopeptidase S2P n=1 Tax=Tribonema minus TaxID=303371 RepID=A0A835ZFB2_9STRA|nr:hypothetical protein JKP88DRAFT_292234 [Tribonema minus]